MLKQVRFIHVLFLCLIVLISGCGILSSDEVILNRHADALLTKNNELQFRFRLNSNFLNGQETYKVKVLIHDRELAEAIGKDEIIYGEAEVQAGEYLKVKEDGEEFILMDPIPLQKDLHISDIKKMIVKENAVSIEIFNDQEVFGRAYLKNFSSEM